MIQVSLNTVEVPTYVALIDSTGVVVDSAAIYPNWPATVGDSLAAGTYFIAIGAASAGKRSVYWLRSEKYFPQPHTPYFGCTVSQPYTIGSEVTSVLGLDDCYELFDTAPMELYDFNLPESRRITIELLSDAFYETLYLFDEQGMGVATRSGGGRYEDISLTLTLPAGTYSIGVTSWVYMDVGSYTLRSH